MHATLIGQVLGSGEGDSWRDDALDGGVVGEVEEEHCAAKGAVLLKVPLEEVRSLHVDTHCAENDRKLVLQPYGSTITLAQEC